MSEKPEIKTTIFAVRTTIGRERTVQDLVFNRLRTINPVPDLKAIFTADLYRGFIFIEAIHQRDVVHITSGVPHVKGKVVGSIPFDAVEKVIKPEKVITSLEEGDIVEIIGGVFQNKKAQIVKMPKEGGKEDITVRLLDSDSALTVKLSADFLKLYDKGKKITTEYVLTKETQQEFSEGEDVMEIPLDEGEEVGSDIENLSAPSEESLEEKNIIENEEAEKEVKKTKKGKKEGKPKSEKEAKPETPTKVIISEEAVSTSMDEKFSFDDDLKDEEFEKEEEVPEKPAKKKKAAKTDEDEEEAEEDDDWAKFF